MPNSTIVLPGGYAVASAIGFADETDGSLSVVTADRPLPVATVTASPPPPLAGSTASSGDIGPFTPALSRPVLLTLGGDWQGEVQVLRSIDGGSSRHGLTLAGAVWGAYQGNACEVVWEEIEDGAQLYLSVQISAGSLAYRLAQ